MKRCPTCGRPISTNKNGALPTSSTICPTCKAPIPSVAPSESSQKIEENPSESLAFPPDSSPDSISTESTHSRTSPDQDHAQTLPKTTGTNPLTDIERKPNMENELDIQKADLTNEDPLPTPEERAEARKQSLSRQGFVVEEDVHGLRLSGMASRPGGLSSQLSPYDVVRLAAELEGGVVPIEQRKRCPKCDAVVSPGDKLCQWCSESL